MDCGFAVQEPYFVLQTLDLSIFNISDLFSFDCKPEPVYYLVGKEGESEGLEEGATMGAV